MCFSPTSVSILPGYGYARRLDAAAQVQVFPAPRLLFDKKPHLYMSCEQNSMKLVKITFLLFCCLSNSQILVVCLYIHLFIVCILPIFKVFVVLFSKDTKNSWLFFRYNFFLVINVCSSPRIQSIVTLFYIYISYQRDC